jgi:hypothetical protein
MDENTLDSFDSQFYSFFNNFQIDTDDKNSLDFDQKKTIV